MRVGAAALAAVCACAAPALGQVTTYSEDFTAGVSNDPGSPQVDNWETFRDGLTGAYSNITVGGSEGPDIVCSDLAAVADIATALRTDATTTVTCEGRSWNTGTCVGTNELSVDVGICTCQGASPFTLRPDVDAASAAWGGIGQTCGGAGGNVSQTLTVSVTELVATNVDLSLTLAPASTTPTIGLNTFIDVNINNTGPATGTGVSVDFQLPSGLSYISDDSGGAYNSSTGIWTIGAQSAPSSERLRVLVRVEPTGSYALAAEVASANENDPDSTPGNAATSPGEDDDGAVTLVPTTPPPPLFCLGRPIQPLVFVNPVAESPGANLVTPQMGDVFRFPNVASGADALVEVTAFNNGASLSGIDNDGTVGAPVGVPDNFQPTLVGPAGDVSVDFEIRLVSTGTSIAGTLDFAGSAIDVDGNSGGLREYIEVSDNIVEFALNGVPVPADPTGPATRLVTQANVPPDAGASAPSATDRVRFEAQTDDTAAGIDPNEPRNIAAAFFTDVSVFQYRIGKLGGATAGRLNSLAFNCPNIDPGSGGSAPVVDEDFGDAPFDASTNPGYGNPIHVVDEDEPLVQLGATNTTEFAAGNSPTASSDAGDDGVTIGGASLQGQTLQGFVSTTITIAVTNASPDAGLLQAFFDWNADGDFDDAGEQVATDVQDGDGDGTIELVVTPPESLGTASSFARFRWATGSVGVQDATGDGEVEDYAVELLAGNVQIDAAKTVLVFDPNGDGLFAVPGNDVTYTITVTNSGNVAAGPDSVVLIDDLPPEITFFNGDADGPGPGTDPVNYVENVPTGLDPFVFADHVRFSDQTARPSEITDCNYVPQTGFDPAVTFICFNPEGSLLAGDPDPSFSVSFRARIR
ncbi:MAG: DUF11 domain-containing protein [Hyphomonadaceae bacterium]